MSKCNEYCGEEKPLASSHKDNSFFTLVEPKTEREARIFFRKENKQRPFGTSNIILTVHQGDEEIELIADSTQLTELGALFIALGGGKVEPDDVGELLQGYEMGLKVCPIRKTIS